MANTTLETIEVSRIHTTDKRFMPRDVDTTSEKYLQIKESIKERGLLNAIAVAPLGNGDYKLIDGLRRLTAHRELGREFINATIIEDVEENVDVLADGLLANLAREDMTKKERAQAYRTLVDEGKFTVQELAARTGNSPASIYQLMGILKLPEECQKLVDKNIMPLGNAARLVAVVKYAPSEDWWRQWRENACTLKQQDFKAELDASVAVLKEQIKKGEKKTGKVTGPNPKLRTQGEILGEFASKVEDLPRDDDGYTDTSKLNDFQKGWVECLKWAVQQDDESVRAWHKERADKEAEKEAAKKKALAEALSDDSDE